MNNGSTHLQNISGIECFLHHLCPALVDSHESLGFLGQLLQIMLMKELCDLKLNTQVEETS